MKKGIIILLVVILILMPLFFRDNENMESDKDEHKPDVVKITFNDPKDYIIKMLPTAKLIEKKYGIPYLFLLAQTALETNWGKSSLVREAANFAGIKARPQQDSVTKYTTEYVSDISKYPQREKSKDSVQADGKTKIYLPQKFARYKSLEDGIENYVSVLLLPRYKAAFNYTDPFKFADEIRKGGYATDPNYTNKISQMINSVKKYIA